MNEPTKKRSALLRWAAVLTGAAVALSLGATPAQAAPDDPATVVSLTFDDGNDNQQTAVDLLNQYGMKGTFFITTGFIDSPSWLTRPQLTAIAAAGHEIGGHAVTHPDLTKIPIAEAKSQICESRATLAAWGFPTRSFAYPFAVTNAAVKTATAECGFNSGRQLGDIGPGTGTAAESVPPADAFETKAADQVSSSWTLQDMQDLVTNAENSGGGWVQLTFHHICTTGCDPALTTTPEIFEQFLAWLAPRAATENTTVKTVGDVVGGATKPVSGTTFPDAPGAGVNGVTNASLETPGTDGLPQCWAKGGFGQNNAAFSIVSAARTGTAAAQLTVTDRVSGDAKLIVTQDLGTCAPTVTPGQTYSLRAWYTSTVPTQFDVYLRDSSGIWSYLTSSPQFNASPTYTQATWTTDVIPPGTTGISFGLNLIQNGTLVTDDYALYNTVGAPDAGAPSVVSTSRLSGVDRYATAVEVSKSGFAPGVARVYVATGYNFPDALSAAPAAARAKSPVLLTDQGTLPDVVRDEIRRLKPAQIVVVGGAPSVSEAVFAQLKALAPAVRIAGDDRYATSRAIAKDAFGTTGARTAYIATGTNFPDALAAGPAAARYDGPILLVPGNATTLDAATRALIEELGITQVRIAGGTPSLSAGIEAGIRDTRGVTAVSRFAGADRLATAAAINRDAFPTGDTIYLAMSTNFPDALVGSALAGLQGRPLFLTQTQCTDQGVLDGIKRMGATKVVLLGGTPSLSEAVARLAPC